jgi:hypothetical protein
MFGAALYLLHALEVIFDHIELALQFRQSCFQSVLGVQQASHLLVEFTVAFLQLVILSPIPGLSFESLTLQPFFQAAELLQCLGAKRGKLLGKSPTTNTL